MTAGETGEAGGRQGLPMAAWPLLAVTAFFLLAALAAPPGPPGRGGRRNNDSAPRVAAPPRQADSRLEDMFAEVYRQTFLRLRDERKQFLDIAEAKAVFPGGSESRRRAHCGGWASNIPSLVLRLMGRRCPPLALL